MKQALTNYKTIVITLIVGIFGAFLLYSALQIPKETHPEIREILVAIGSYLIGTIPLAVVFDLLLRRNLRIEMLDAVRIGQSVDSSGIVQVHQSFQNFSDWEQTFKDSHRVELFFSYGSSWRNTHRHSLIEFLKKRRAKLIVILPDPDDALTVQALARQFIYSEEKMKGKINDAISEFKEIAADANAAGKLEIKLVSTILYFSAYRFDNLTLVSFYSHRRNRAAVPTFELKTSGSFSNKFIAAELEHLKNSGRVP